LQIPVPAELFDEMGVIYAPPDHSVFELVPPLFRKRADRCYADIGQPMITSDTFWDIYRSVLARFRAGDDIELATILRTNSEQETAEKADQIPVLANMKPFRNGPQVVGRGVRYIGGLSESSLESSGTAVLGEGPEFADFTSDEGEDEEDEEGLL
jgi:hypothetical protein